MYPLSRPSLARIVFTIALLSFGDERDLLNPRFPRFDLFDPLVPEYAVCGRGLPSLLNVE